MPGREARAALALGLLVVLLAAPVAGCGHTTGRPGLVLILIDTLRADHLGAYGYSRNTTPFLDSLASRGVLFQDCIAAAPWTLPSAMSLMTGRLPSGHRVENDGMKLSAGIPTLAEVLQASGYSTSAVISHIYVSGVFGFDRGFQRFEDFGLTRDYRFEAGLEPRASKVTDRAAQLFRGMKRARGGGFFLFVHYFDPHWDYDPPPPFDKRFGSAYHGAITGSYQSFSHYALPGVEMSPADRQHLVDLYDGEIAYTDAQIGRLLETLRKEGAGEDTLVVVTADHGEEFKEHGALGHGRNLYDEVIRVPLIAARLGGKGPVRRVREQVRDIDIFPTFCEIAGATVPAGVRGKSLTGFLAGKQGSSRGAVSETIRFDAYRKSYREPGRKLIVRLEDNRHEYYDLTADPGETRNLWEEKRTEALALEQELFSRTEVLPGGWNLRWSSDGSPHRFSGSIETDGLITSLIPLFAEAGRHHVIQGKRIDFDLKDVGWGGGLSFSVDPPGARVGFALALDGREGVDFVEVGKEGIRPPVSPFSFSGALPDGFRSRPTYRPGGEIGFFLWKSPAPSPTDSVELTDAMKERLRSLGYLH
jgi:arylsulfatase A-like enzyme